MLFFTSVYVQIIDNPIADSVAAIDKTNKTNIWPIMSSNCIENTIKFKLTARSINSRDMSTIIKLFRFKAIPETPIKNKKLVTNIITCKLIF